MNNSTLLTIKRMILNKSSTKNILIFINEELNKIEKTPDYYICTD